jgi:hypothetical protein
MRNQSIILIALSAIFNGLVLVFAFSVAPAAPPPTVAQAHRQPDSQLARFTVRRSPGHARKPHWRRTA